MKRFLSRYFPLEKLTAPYLILAVALIIISTIITRLTEIILDLFIENLSSVWKSIISLLLTPITINPLTIIIIFIVIFPLYHLIVRLYIKVFNQSIIFKDNFTESTNHWGLNYWQGKASSIKLEDNHLVFETSPGDWQGSKGVDGAFMDLTYGIYEGHKYEVSCQVKSSPNSTIGFQLWVHDTIGNDPSMYLFDPPQFETPPTTYKTYKVIFQASSTKSLRIHLHGREGTGKLMIKQVKVSKI